MKLDCSIYRGETSEASRPTRGRRLVFGSLSKILCCFLLLPSIVSAKSPLRVELVPLSPRARTAAPFHVEARLHWDGLNILEGHLELEFRDNNRVLGTHRSAPLALTTGDQAYRMMLPSVPASGYDSQVEVLMRFVSAKETFPLEPAALSVPKSGERSFVVAWCSTREGPQVQTFAVERLFPFEQYMPSSLGGTRLSTVTTMARLVPTDLPVQPLAYSAFDIVVLTGEAFAGARERQLDALLRWVQAGGSLCVFQGKELSQSQQEFLQKLKEENGGRPVSSHGSISNYYAGLGRCVLVATDAGGIDQLEMGVLAQKIPFLWKMRESRNRQAPPADSSGYNAEEELGGQTLQLGSGLVNQLLPRTIRLIPFPVLVTLLGLFVLAIGPFDYFILGWIKRRRYTWVLFPLTTAGFTVVTVLMANHYLGQRDQRRALVVVDVGTGGTVLRQNRYELLFAARDKETVTDLTDSLWAPLQRSQSMEDGNPNYYNNRYNRGRYGNAGYLSSSDVSLGSFEGSVPAHFQVRQSLRQWEPVLNRLYSLKPYVGSASLNWSGLDNAVKNGVQAAFLKDSILGNSSTPADLYIYSSSSPYQRVMPNFLDANIVRSLCGGTYYQGLFSQISAVSPTGGNNFEDAVVWNSADPREMLVVVVVKDGDDVVMYRRLYHGK